MKRWVDGGSITTAAVRASHDKCPHGRFIHKRSYDDTIDLPGCADDWSCVDGLGAAIPAIATAADDKNLFEQIDIGCCPSVVEATYVDQKTDLVGGSGAVRYGCTLTLSGLRRSTIGE